MTISVNIRNGNASAIPEANAPALVIGPGHLGTHTKDLKIETVADTSQLFQLAVGPASEAASVIMNNAPDGFGVCDIIYTSASVAGLIDTVSAGSPTITLTGNPTCTQDVRARVTVAGPTGSLRFQYTRDGQNYTDELQLDEDGEYLDLQSGLTFVFDEGEHAAGNSCHYDVYGPSMTPGDLSKAIQTLSGSNRNYSLVLIADETIDAETAGALVSTFDTHLSTLASQEKPTIIVGNVGGETFKYNRAPEITAGPTGSSDVIAEAAGVDFSVGNFGVLCAEKANTLIIPSQPGYSSPRKPLSFSVAAKIHGVGNDISFGMQEGTLPGIITSAPGRSAVSYDERQFGEVYRPAKLLAPTTRRGLPGTYLSSQFLKYNPATAASLNVIPRARVMNRAVEVARGALQTQLGKRLPIRPDGSGRLTLAKKDALEDLVNRDLRVALLEPINGDGETGHVSAAQFSIVDTNLLANPTLFTKVIMVPFGYVDEIVIDLFFNDVIVS